MKIRRFRLSATDPLAWRRAAFTPHTTFTDLPRMRHTNFFTSSYASNMARGWFVLAWMVWLSTCMVLAATKLRFMSAAMPWGPDAGFYLNVARHIRDGQGVLTSVSLYHQGMPTLPHPSSIYPLWPWLLGMLAHH
jgi:hypothetical protein